jgi:hypothetical protein
MGTKRDRLERAAFPLQSLRPRARLAILTAVLGSVALALQVGVAFSHGTAWVFESEAGHSSTEAELQGPASCEGVVGIPIGLDPGWVRVGGSTSPSTAFVEARGQILRAEPAEQAKNKTNPFVTWTDVPMNHYSKDINIFVTLDPAYRYLLADGNFQTGGTPPFLTGDHNEHALLEIEWERGGIPLFAFPASGDRITVWGAHIWDCGHGDAFNLLYDDKYRTEIHPPVGWVLYRQTADADGIPTDGKRTQNPWKYYEVNDLDGIGVTLPTTGLRNTPVQATVADAFFSSFGGNAPESLNGCDTDDLFIKCTQENEWRQSLLQQDYTFFVPAPPKPDPDALMVWESEDRCSQVPANPGNPPGDDIEEVGEADDTAENIGAPACTIPDQVEVSTDFYGRPGIQVTVKARSSGIAYPANQYIAFAKRYKVAWDWVPDSAQRAKTYRVVFNHMKVYDDAEPCGEDGEWVVSIRVNQAWIHPVRGQGDGDPFWSNGAIDDDKCSPNPLHTPTFRQYPVNEALTVSVVAGRALNVWSFAYDLDVGPNDPLPVIDAFHDVPNTYESGETNRDREGAHTLNYTITDVTPASPSLGTLEIGTPKYGPNDDTGGSHTRITGSTPITLKDSNAAQLQYRAWKDGEAKPSGWTFDSDKTFTLGHAGGDGRYTVEYAPVSSAGVVAQRRVAHVELDTTAPELTVPGNLVVDATSATGANVAYQAAAVDNLPGPVTFSCAPPSGSFFPIKKTTTVSCTATDAVGNSVTKAFTIEVVSPFGYIPDFVVLGRDWAHLDRDARVESGNVGAFTSSSGVPGWPSFEVVVGSSTRLLGGPKLAAESVRLLGDVRAGNVYTVHPVVAGADALFTQRTGYVPLFPALPAFPAFSAAGSNVRVRSSQALAPGSYGAVDIQPGATLSLSPGNYYLKSLSLSPDTTLTTVSTGPAKVHVTGWVSVGSGARLGTTTAGSLVVYVAGTGGPPGQQSPFATGTDARVVASVYAANGTLELGPTTVARGTFLGRRVVVANGAKLTLEGGAFDIPYP